ncbi:18863_t:CDS:1, partial [Racocetra fulgida]
IMSKEMKIKQLKQEIKDIKRKREKDKIETEDSESSSIFQQMHVFNSNLSSDSHQRKPKRRETMPKTSNKTNKRKYSLPNHLSIPNAINQSQATNDRKG